MKATIDIPDELYRAVKVRSASEGHTVREVTIRLFEEWLHGPPTPRSSSRVEELESTYGAADRTFRKASGKKTAAQHLQEDRNRLEGK